MEYKIENIGWQGKTEGVFYLTKREYEIVDTIFKILNENSNDEYMPKIHIKGVER